MKFLRPRISDESRDPASGFRTTWIYEKENLHIWINLRCIQRALSTVDYFTVRRAVARSYVSF